MNMQESQDFKPVGRRGVCSFVHNSSFYLYGGALSIPGLSAFRQTPHVDIEMLDMHSGLWSSVETEVLHSLPQFTSGACCAVLNDNLYIFGGWLAGLRNAHIHELDLETFCWKKLPINNPENGPICKDKAAMFGYGDDMMGVFGGYGYPENDAHARLEGRAAQYHRDTTNPFFSIYWTNELHLFHVGKCTLSRLGVHLRLTVKRGIFRKSLWHKHFPFVVRYRLVSAHAHRLYKWTFVLFVNSF